jgi:SAM-dependent methyltransferase
MRILFVTMASISQGPAGPTSSLASARYRVLIPAQQLGRLGHAVQIASLPPGPVPAGFLKVPCDAMVLSKSFFPEHEALVAAMQSQGVKVIADYCDDHFEHPQHGGWYAKLARMADVVVASTEAMAAAIRKHTGREATVITDPVEGRRGQPRFEPRLPALRILWFGHPTNLGGLTVKAGELQALAARMPVEVTLVTEPSPEAQRTASDLAAASPGRLRGRVVPWSLEATWKSLEEADVVWIPIVESDKKAVKSPNRLTESLWAGRLVVADSIPAYMPFADLVPVGTGLEKGVMDALGDPARALAGIREAQRRIARDHSAFECGRRWAEAAGDAVPRPVKLNLGCGDKILPGYVNVDVVEARAGMRPDVVCDLHDLAPFDDASADEILSVHVVEHFWRWEIRDVMREWVRVLKPGGRMIVECPNLQSACRTFLENPAEFAKEDRSGQRTMWVFYGDPAWKDPLMIHRWGYTPESLKELLTEVGLADVRQEPAQFKLREPRDMRIAGTKP